MFWRLWKELLLLVAVISLGVYGGYNLLGWYSSGHHWANFKSRGEPNNYTLIGFADHPLNLAGLLAVDVLFVVVGCVAAITLIRLLLVLHRDKADQ
jgi:hypothetical protein